LEDNFLEDHEIYRLNLAADLIVLSTCETGYGKFEQGEGIMSLTHSFMCAGTPSLIVSLWQVNNKFTAIIMKSFYDELVKGTPKDAALRQAKLEYIKSTKGITGHSAFWSSFIQLVKDKK
jgi:CHAT domain-containing protein